MYLLICLAAAVNSTIGTVEQWPLIGQFHVSENILITFLIAVTSRLHAVDAHKNVLQPTRIRRSTVIKRSS